MGYHHQLKQFLIQAKTDNLKTKHYDSNYNGLEVKVSFGQGNAAKIPWISYLKKPNKTSKEEKISVVDSMASAISA